jgi:hypothetical protein
VAGQFSDKWYQAFLKVVQQPEMAGPLKESAIQERLAVWTQELTRVVVSTCGALGWKASAKKHQLDLLPVARSEYLGLDIVAFAEGQRRWRFPVAVVELENSREDDRIAYSLWKVLCVRANLRIVFCYRRSPESGAGLARFLRDEVVNALGISSRMYLEGEVVLVIGSRDEASTFPYGFFKWWKLDANTGMFKLL